MKYCKLCILLIFFNPLYAMVKIENLSNLNFGLIRQAMLPSKESTLWISFENYTVTIAGQHNQSQKFHLANGVYLVPYRITWKDTIGNAVDLLPNIVSPIFRGNANNDANIINKKPAILCMTIVGSAPQPGHYSDMITLIITPA